MKTTEEKIKSTFVDLVEKAGIKDPPELEIEEGGDAGHSSYYSKVIIGEEHAARAGLNFVIAHELGHHEQEKMLLTNVKTVVTSKMAGIGFALLGVASAIECVCGRATYTGALASFGLSLCSALLSIGLTYYREFNADEFAAKHTSPEEGVEFFKRVQEEEKKLLQYFDSLGSRVQHINTEHISDSRAKKEAEEERKILRQDIKQDKKRSKPPLLQRLLCHPPDSWRIKVLERMAEKQNKDQDNTMALE